MALYSLTEIAQELNVAPSTLRYQAKQYEDLLPKREVEGERWPKYEQEALEILKLVMDESSAGKSREEIKDLIYQKYETVYHEGNQVTQLPAKSQTESSLSMPVVGVMQEAHELNTTLMDMVRSQRDIIRFKDEELELLREKVATLEQELQREKRDHQRVREASSFFKAFDSLFGKTQQVD